MKKIAIGAVLATAALAASAQNVQIYGIVDAYVGRDSGETKINSGGLKTNRIGLRGSEDLGSGLTAKFQLEQGFNVDDGTARGVQFDRHAWVGVAHKTYGEVRLGRTWTSMDDFVSEFNQMEDVNFGVGRASESFVSNAGNQIKYISPTVAGFQGSIGHATAEGNLGLNTKVTSATGAWRSGNLALGVAVQDDQSATIDRRHHAVGASYNLGFAKVTGTIGDTRQATGNTQRAQAGVSVPMGKLTLHGGLATAQTRSKNEDVRAASILATYDLSKRTALYTGYRIVSTEVAGVTTDAKRTVVGVRHTF